MFLCRKQAAFLQLYQAALFLPLLTQAEVNTFVFSKSYLYLSAVYIFSKWFFFSVSTMGF